MLQNVTPHSKYVPAIRVWEGDVGGYGTGMWGVGFRGRTEPTRARCCFAARLLALGGSRRGLGDGFGTVVEGQILRMEGVQVVNLCVTFPTVVQS